MLFATLGQGRLFLWMMAAGAVIGAWYALTALLRRAIQAGFWLTLGCDLLFGVGSAAILIAALILGDYGQARPFALLGALCGAALFGFGVTPPAKWLGRKLRRGFRRIVTRLSENRLIKVIFR